MPKSKKRSPGDPNPEKLEFIRQQCLKANPTIGKRPTHLADVIFMLQDHKQDQLPDAIVSILCQGYWNLRQDDLALQEEEAIDYIYWLLTETDRL